MHHSGRSHQLRKQCHRYHSCSDWTACRRKPHRRQLHFLGKRRLRFGRWRRSDTFRKCFRHYPSQPPRPSCSKNHWNFPSCFHSRIHSRLKNWNSRSFPCHFRSPACSRLRSWNFRNCSRLNWSSRNCSRLRNWSSPCHFRSPACSRSCSILQMSWKNCSIHRCRCLFPACQCRPSQCREDPRQWLRWPHLSHYRRCDLSTPRDRHRWYFPEHRAAGLNPH